MTRCSRRAFVEFHERNHRARLARVPSLVVERVHIVLLAGQSVGLPLCRLGKPRLPFEPAPLDAKALPCPECFDRARQMTFRLERKEEETPGVL